MAFNDTLTFVVEQASVVSDNLWHATNAAANGATKFYFANEDDIQSVALLATALAAVLLAFAIAYNIVVTATQSLTRLWFSRWHHGNLYEFSATRARDEDVSDASTDDGSSELSLNSSQPFYHNAKNSFVIFITATKLQQSERVHFINGRETSVVWKYTSNNIDEFESFLMDIGSAVHVFYRNNVDEAYTYLGLVGSWERPRIFGAMDLFHFDINNPFGSFVKCNHITRRGTGKFQRAAFTKIGLKRPSRGLAPGFFRTT